MTAAWILLALVALSALTLWAVGRRIEGMLNRVKGPVPPRPSDAALRLHRESFVVDLHADPLLWGRDLARKGHVGHVDLPRLQEGNVTLQVFGLVTQVPIGTSIDRTDPARADSLTFLGLSQGWPLRVLRSRLERARFQCERLVALSQKPDSPLRVIRTRQDLDRLLADRREDPRLIGGLLCIEGAHALGSDPENLTPLFDAGVRMIGLAHFFDTAFSGSAHGLEKGGLTPAGEKLIQDMERLGVCIDLAHSSPATIRDVLSRVTRPIVVSHTGVRGTVDNNRNLSDDQVRAVADAGGVIGIGFWVDAVGGTAPSDIARAARHAVNLVGDDHVGLGSDFNGSVETSFDVSRMDVVTEALLEVGLPESSVRKILGENALRVLRTTLPVT
jgi:microsomal dipeptidase-like Zn-dependent dipeptidase